MATNTPGADEIVLQRHIRAFTQRGGPRATLRTRYAGADDRYLTIGNVANPVRGGISPIYTHDPFQRESFRAIASQRKAPDLPSTTVSFSRAHGAVSWLANDLRCPSNFYELVGECRKPDDFQYGWADFVTIYSYGWAESRSMNGRTARDSDDPMMDEIGYKFAAIYDIGGLSFGELGAVATEREVVDVHISNNAACGNCGIYDDGASRIYWLAKSSGAGSPGTPAEVIWTPDKVNVYQQNITGLGGTSDPTAIEVVGSFLVVLDTAGGGYYYAEINQLTGAPSNWTNVTAGFSSGNNPTDIYVLSSTEVYFSGRNGRIYRSTDITSGVVEISSGDAVTANLLRIDGSNDTILAVGESGQVAKSVNRGATWSAVASPTSATLRALDTIDDYTYWIGGSNGGVWYTVTGGDTWTLLTLSGITVVDDIIFATDEVGYITGRTSTPAGRMYTTYNGGFSWSNSGQSSNPRILSFKTVQRCNRIGVPRNVHPGTASNTVALACLSSGGTDGALLLGTSNVK